MSWNDFFVEEYINKTGVNTFLQIEKSTWVYDCTFISLNSEHDGAAILFDSESTICLLVELSTFHSCTAYEKGGAIYFYGQGDCVIHSSCGYKCSSGTGHFSYLYHSEITDSMFSFIDSTITLSYNSPGIYTTYFNYGNISLFGVNISHNTNSQNSGTYILLANQISISYSSYRNNTSISYCIYCSSESNMVNCNIIENVQTTDSTNYGIIHAKEIMSIIYCSIFGNIPGSGVVIRAGSKNVT